MRTIENLWQDYKKQAVGSGTPPIMLVRYKKAFFAGSEGILKYLESLPTETPEETAQQILKNLKDEIYRFKESLKTGKSI